MTSHKIREVEVLLQKLHLQISPTGDSDDAKDAVIDLSEVFSSSFTEEDSNLYIALLFNSGGLVDFCRLVASDSRFVDAKKNALELFKSLLEKDVTYLSQHASVLEKLCRHLYNADSSSKVRCVSFDVFCILLTRLFHCLDFGDFNFKQFIEQICLDVRGNKGSLVVASQLHTLGVVLSSCPEKTRLQAKLVFKVLRDQLSKRTGSRPDFTAAAGAIRGLTFYLNHFPEGDDDNESFYSRIYPDIHKLLNPDLNLPRRDVQRAALDLIHKHGSKFAEDLLRNYEELYRWISRWCRSSNRDDHKVALRAMDTFMVVLGNILELRAEDDRTMCTRVFRFLLKEFSELLEGSRSSSQVSLSVKGYGLLAGACRVFLSPEVVMEMFSKVLTVSQQGFFQSSEMLETKVANLPSYIESLGIIVSKLDSISIGMCESVLQLTLALAENFSFVSRFKDFLAYRSLFTVFASIRDNRAVYQTFIHGFVYHFMIHTCSHTPILDADNVERDMTSKVDRSADSSPRTGWTATTGLKGETESYKNFVPLWEAMLLTQNIRALKVSGRSTMALLRISQELFEEFLNCVLEIVEKLDLRTVEDQTPNEEEEIEKQSNCDPFKCLKPTTPKDFQVYINLCCLMEEVLPLQETSLEAHLPRFFVYFVRRSNLEPLVSTHYSILALLLQTADQLRFLEPDKLTPESSASKQLLIGYIDELVERSKLFRDFLLSSCLSLVLKIPSCLVKEILFKLVAPLQMALRLGLSYLPIGRICVSALRRWIDLLTREEVASFYPKVLPMLLPYLRSQESLTEGEMQTRMISVKMSLAKQRRKIDKRKIGEGKMMETSEMRKIQLSILDLLGQLDQSVCSSILDFKEESSFHKLVAWDSQKHIFFPMPFQEAKLDLSLDVLLPHTVDKAMNSSDRQTKVAACEFLHSIIIIMIGTGHQQTEMNKKRGPMSALYRRVFDAMLVLSCDADIVTKQLFVTLTFQTIHWFTNNTTYEHPDVAALLQAIFDGIVSPNDPSLRDWSGRCLLELMKWSRVQSKTKEQVQNNVKSVIKRIMALCNHPCSLKRLGGCLAWNNIYAEVREDELSCDTWMVCLLVSLFACLSQCQRDDTHAGTETRCHESISHVERILRVRSHVFNKPSKWRRLPKDFESGTLDEMLVWLLRKTSTPSSHVRHSSMNLIMALAPHTRGYASGRDFIEKLAKEKGNDFVVGIVEGSLVGDSNSGSEDGPDSVQERRTFKEMSLRLEIFLASLDVYIWIISEGIWNINNFALHKNLKIFLEIRFFMEFYALESPGEILNPLTKSGYSLYKVSLSQQDLLNELRCTAFVRLVDFIVALLNNKMASTLNEEKILGSPLNRLLLLASFKPCDLGFNVKDTQVTKHLPARLKETLSVMRCKLPENVRETCRSEFTDFIKDSVAGLFKGLPIVMDDTCFVSPDCQFAVDGLDIFYRSGWLDQETEMVSFFCDTILEWNKSVLIQESDGGVSPAKPKKFCFKHFGFVQRCLELALLFSRQKTLRRILEQITSKRVLRDLDGRELSLGVHTLSSFGGSFICLVGADPPICVDHAVRLMESGDVAEGIEFINRLLKAMVKNGSFRNQYSGSLMKCIVSKWEIIYRLGFTTAELKSSLLTLVKSAFLADKESVIKTDLKKDNRGSEVTFVSFFKKFLCDSSLQLNVKTEALKLLPFYLSAKDSHTIVKDDLQSFRVRHLPLRLTEYDCGSLREKELKAVLQDLLLALELTGSLELMGFIVQLFCGSEEDRYDDELLETLRRLMTSSQISKQIDILNSLFRSFKNSTNQLFRVAVLEKMMLPCLQHASDVAIMRFYVANVAIIMTDVTLMVKGRDQHRAVVTKYCAFSLIQILYSRVPKEKVFLPGAEVNANFDSSDASGKSLTKEVLRRSVGVAKGELRHDSTHYELRRKCACAAYNAIVAVMSNVQDQPKFYENFLFSEVRSKDEAILESLIDVNKLFEFDVEVSFDPSSKNRFVAVHRKETSSDGSFVLHDANEASTVRYMASHYLSDSSLREDLSQYDFSSSVVLSQALNNSENVPSIHANGISRDAGMTSVRLDQSDFNNHEVMPNLVAILRHLVSKNIIKLHEDEFPPEVSEIPQCLNFFRGKLIDTNAPPNVRLFVCRLIINVSEIFAHYANHFVQPMLSVVVEEAAGKNINYFVADILVTITSWGERGVPQDTNRAYEVFKFLVMYSPQNRADIFKYNLELIKVIVEQWKTVLTIPELNLVELLRVKNGMKREVDAGLQISGILLANDLFPYDQNNEASSDRFTALVLGLIREKSASTYSAAAEVVGLLLKLQSEKKKNVEDFMETVSQTLLTMFVSQQGQALSCVYFIHKHHPLIVKKLINRLLSVLPRLYGIHRERVLQCVVSHATLMDDVFHHLREQKLLEDLTRKEAKTQLVSLELVNAVVHRLQPKQILYFLPGVAGFEFHAAPLCRKLMYETFIWIYDNFNSVEGETEKTLKKEAQIMLLKGTKEEDAALRQSVKNFWVQRAQDLSVADRLLFVFESLYTTETEDVFLQMATHILLEATHSTPDFVRPIFLHPLTECIFREMKVTPGWKAQHASLVPLFADSQSGTQESFSSLVSMTQGSQQMDTEIDAPDSAGSAPTKRVVQATQNYVFSATQQPVVTFGDTYNWVSGSSLDPSLADAEFKATHSTTQSPSSGLMFSGNEEDMSRFKRHDLGNRRMRPDEPDSSHRKSVGAKSRFERQLIRRRFVADRDREKQTTHFARQEETRRKLRHKIHTERKMMREAQVTIYRQYRVGELPDVQIPHKALIAPLQAFADRDDWVASRLFELVSEAIIAEAASLLGPEAETEWRRRLFEAIRAIVEASETCHPHVMRPLISLAMSHDVELCPEHVTSVCLKSKLEPYGLLCLERQRMKATKNIREPAKKKQRTESTQGNGNGVSLSLNMADLYKSLSMWDSVLGILKAEIGQLKDETRRALEAESQMNHYEAYRNYLVAMTRPEWSEDPPTHHEQCLWKEWYISSAETLGQWEEIETLVEEKILASGSGVERLSELWSLPRRTTSFVLPSLVNAKLMKILEGSETDGNLCAFIDKSFTDSGHRDFLESEMALQLAVLAVNQEKHHEASALLSGARVNLIMRLAQCSLLSVKSMSNELKCVQALADLRQFLGIVTEQISSKSEVERRAKKAIAKWTEFDLGGAECSAQTQYSLSYRNLYLHFLKPLIPPSERDLLRSAKISSGVSIIKSSLENSNPHLAYKYLKKLDSLPKDNDTDCLLNFLRAETTVIRAMSKDPQSKIQYLVETWSKHLSKINNYLNINWSNAIEIRYLMLENSICYKICEAICDLKDGFDPNNKYLKSLSQLLPEFDKSLPQFWYKALLDCGRRGMEKADGLFLSQNASPTTVNDKCFSVLKKNNESVFHFYESVIEKFGDYVNAQEFTASFACSVLKGMAAGSKEAHFRFPRLIYLMEEDPSLASLFIEESRRVPTWMYLLWLSHILIYIDKSPGVALHPILKRVAVEYPHALIYPFEISVSTYNFESREGKAAKVICEEVKSILSKFTLVRNFVSAVSLVHLPHIELKDKVKSVKQLNDPKEKAECLLECYKTFFTSQKFVKNACNEKGSVYKNNDKFFTSAKESFEKHGGKDVKKILSLNIEQLKDLQAELDEGFRNNKLKFKPTDLNTYSPWLASFNSLDHSEEIEIPGQYHGISKPLLEYHVKVANFSTHLSPMNSMRVPIKLTICGSDQKEYPFLVKSGEDLRTDHRIESIFSLLNNIYSSQVPSRLTCKPSLVTFEVIPFSKEVGLLEWVGHTQPLSDFLKTFLEDKSVFGKAKYLYDSKESWDHSGNILKKEVCVRNFVETLNILPWDALRKGLFRIASDHEAFFYLRSSFVSSHATICISQWLLGIGDRHLNNFLISLDSGKLVGIDFGYHFEISTQFAPFPELVPFRLTSQILNVMQPLAQHGQFMETMIACLSALKQQRNVIISAVEAFVKQPTEDWLYYAFLQSPSPGSNIGEELGKFSRSKMDDFKKKLHGCNPSDLIVSALSKNKFLISKKKTDAYIDFVQGKGTTRHRAKQEALKSQTSVEFSVSDQVDILIDLATDPNLLGRMYGGWSPYV